MANATDRLYRMPIGDFLRRRPEAQTCQACGSPLPHGAVFCPSCGVRTDDPHAEPLHIVDRTTGLFNDRFVRPVLEDELARAHRYQRNLGVLLVEANGSLPAEESLKAMAAALAGTVRDVDTPGVLGRTPPQLLAILPDTDVAGTAHAANRVLAAVNEALKPQGGQAVVGLVCIRPGQRVRAGAVIESAGRSLRSGRPEMMGKPA
jgi:PleD family two-component response regulator